MDGRKSIITSCLMLASLCLMSAVTSAQSCSPGCTCLGPMMICNSAGLRNVPQNIPSTTTHLYLKNNRITIIYREAFADAPNLSVLHLGSNFLSNPFIQEGSFDNLVNLETIVLSDNRLSSFPYRKLRGLQANLQNLDLSDNLIRRIEPGVLSQFKNLQELLLARTGLSYISPDTFMGPALLQTLNLDFNNLSVIPTEAIQQLAELKKLSLRGNPISKVALEGLSVLKYLDLGEMKLTELGEDVFQSMPYLVILLLDGNKLLSQVGPSAFLSLTRLKYLTLHNCGLVSLPPTTLDAMWSLQSVSLNQNPFRCDQDICGMVWWLQETEVELINGDNITCNQPSGLEGMHVNVTIAEGVCLPEPEILLPEEQAPEATDNGSELIEETFDPPPVEVETEKGDAVDDRDDDDGTNEEQETGHTLTENGEVDNGKEETEKVVTDAPISSPEEQHNVEDENKAKGTTNSVVDRTDPFIITPEEKPTEEDIDRTKTTTEPRTNVDDPNGEELETSKSTEIVDNNTEKPLPQPSINLTERQELKAPDSEDRKVESETEAPTDPARTPRRKKTKAKPTTAYEVEGTDLPDERRIYDECPQGCRCRRWYVNCSDSDLTAVPRSLPASTRYLYLYRNKITSLPSGVLSYLSELRLLDLTSNLITNDGLKSGSFKMLTKLDALYLSTNRLRSFPKEELAPIADQLEYLAIAGNFFQNIPSLAFERFRRLQQLFMGNMRLTSLELNSLRGLENLQILHLEYNKMSAVPTRELMNKPYLKHLSLRGNPIRMVKEGSFPNLQSLELLDLGGTSIRNIGQPAFRPLTNLRTLLLSGSSRLVRLKKKSLLGLTNLRYLDVTNCALRDIHPDVFRDTKSIYRVALADNPFICSAAICPMVDWINEKLPNTDFMNIERATCAEPDFLRGRSLLTLQGALGLPCRSRPANIEESRSIAINLVECPISCACQGQSVDCKNRGLREILTTFPYQTKSLDLGNNMIGSIPPGTFVNLPNLERLNLENNDLRDDSLVSGSFYGLGQLKHLNLSNNQFSVFPEETQSLGETLEVLDISGNKISRIGPETFADFENLQALHMKSMSLRRLERASLTGMKNLTTLHLDSNRLTIMPNKEIQSLRSLKNLTMRGNPVKHISKKSLYHFPAVEQLDIRDMRLKKLGKRIFNQIPSLKTLKLSGNVQLSSVHRTSLAALKNLQHLEMDNCNLTTLPRETLEDLTSLSYCTLQSNPWKCKGLKFCGLYEWLVRGTVEVPFQDEIQCGSPSSERWRPLRSVSINKICPTTDTKPTQVPDIRTTTPLVNDTVCPSNCSCRVDNSVYCSHAGLNAIPTPLAETTASLFLDHNNISELNPSEFEGLPNLQVLDLTTNLLTFDSIDDTTFASLTKLRYLYLSKNKFTSIPMYVPSSTYYLDVQGNQITGVREDVLSELLRNVPSLNWIALEDNPWHCDPDVCTLRRLFDAGAIRLPYPEKMLCSTPPNLKNLAVMGPYIQQFCETEGFPSPVSVEANVTTTSATTAEPTAVTTTPRTKDCPSMCTCTTEGYVNCANADLTSPPSKLPVRTRHLNLAQNLIRYIGQDDLRDLPNLKVLELQGNGMTNTGIEDGFFERLSSLEYLFLSDNELTSVPEKLPPKLYYLELHANRIKALPSRILSRIFENPAKLPTLTLHENPWTCDRDLCRLIQWIHSGAVHVPYRGRIVCDSPEEFRRTRLLRWGMTTNCNDEPPETTTVTLTTTDVDEEITPSCPTGCLCNVADGFVDCSGIGLREFPGNIPPGTRHLSLADNYVEEISAQSVAHLQGVEVLDIKNNKITLNGLSEAPFSELIGLKFLVLTDNKLTQIPSPDTLPDSLKVLHLDNNYIISIPPERFRALSRGLPSLGTLSLRGNPYRCNRQFCELYTALLASRTITIPFTDRISCYESRGQEEPFIAEAFCSTLDKDESDENPTTPTIAFQPYPTYPAMVDNADAGIEQPGRTVPACPDAYPASKTACPKRCRCTHQVIDCIRTDMEKIPVNLFGDTRNLFLEANRIQAVPSCTFWGLPHLQLLDLHGNTLKNEGLDQGSFLGIQNLTYIYLSNNLISSVPAHLPTTLLYLYLNHNHISMIPTGIFDRHGKLRRLYIEHNLLRDSGIETNSFQGLRSLRFLSLAANQLLFVPKNMPQSLTHLVLDDNKIDFLPPKCFQGLHKLQLLSLNNNSLPDHGIHSGSFAGLHKLTRLYLSTNKLKSVPYGLPKTLEDLNLDRNQIPILDRSKLKSLENLMKLSVAWNNVTLPGIPPKIFDDLQEITHLDLDGNNIESVPEYLPRKLEILKLSNNLISMIPNNVFHITPKITEIHLANNSLSNFAVPQQVFYNLDDLTTLDLSGNYLNTVPSELPGNLRYLFLQQNYITDMKADMSHMGKLQWLVLGNNRLTSRYFPHQIFGHLGELKHLDLSHNYLEEVPPNLPRSLEFLYLNNNGIETIQEDTFMGLPFLKALDLSNNYLAESRIASGSLRRLSALRSLNLSDNDFRKPLAKTELPYNLQEYNP
ncbi:PODN [Branchiostoma lanceolatum]|uniref:PODN protein n=1 Tax=Branchiostoma lanceolatum TaxID=7740 RepID=A0A8K0ETD7_BRALA|nr:PODN [Branchiostoma lanceolatum]